MNRSSFLNYVVTKQMLLFVKWCFVIDTKRLSPLHTSLTGKTAKHLLKKQLPRHAFRPVAYLHIFATLHISNFMASPASAAQKGGVKVPGDAWGHLVQQI